MNALQQSNGVIDTTTSTCATYSGAAATFTAQWAITSKKGVTTQHSRETVRGLFNAPPKVRAEVLNSADLRQLTNGNFAPIRDGLALIKGKDEKTLQASVLAACSVETADGQTLVPIIDFANIRTKVHAVAVAQHIAGMVDCKGRKLAFVNICGAWLRSMAPAADAPAADAPAADAPVAADPVAADPVAADPVAADPVAADPVADKVTRKTRKSRK